jgi:hypothetical protein
MSDINTLQQYIDFYKRVMPQLGNAGTGYESAMNNANYNGAALRFAMGQGGPGGGNGGAPSQMPDYFNFSGSSAAPTAAQPGTNPYSARVQSLQANPFGQQPERGQVMNFLARYLK